MNKQIIIRIAISFAFFAFALRVLIPLLYDFFKLKLNSTNNHNDIDWMIKKKKEQLRSEYGVTTREPKPAMHSEANNTAKDILKHISTHYSYNLNESKINQFLIEANKKKLTNFLSDKNRNNTQHQINFLSQALILSLIVDEIVKKNFTMSQVMAKKLSMSLYEFTMGVQIKILLHMSAENRTEEQVFNENYVLNSFSLESLNLAMEIITQKESQLWAQSPSLLFEELSLYFHFASIVQPLPLLQNKSDTKTALLILGCQVNDSIEDIKKKYKKIALNKHPDKITAQKLPPKLEKKGIENFSRIQEAYEILTKELT